MGKYMKLSKKKDNEKHRTEAASDVQVVRKKFHRTALHYYSALNALQYKRSPALIEPLIGLLNAHRVFFNVGQEFAAKPDVEEFLGNMSSSLQR